jgi:NTE family protein
VLRPSRNLGALARGSGVKLPPLLRWGVRMAGGEQAAGADLLSYLVFDPAYTNMLIDLGYADAQAEWERIERFLEATAP